MGQIYSGMQISAGDLLGYVGNYEDGEGGSVFGKQLKLVM